MSDEKRIISIIGSGLIGQSWAKIFSGSGFRVNLYDISEELVQKAIAAIREDLTKLVLENRCRSKLTVEEHMKLIKGCSSFEETLKDSYYVQECAPENKQIKRKVFEDISKYVNNDCILASSSSTMPVSEFASGLERISQMIISHPVNPPYFVPLVEIVPSKETNDEVVKKTRKLMEEIGQSPVVLKKEVAGFAVNRLQYALLHQCWALAAEGIMSVEDVDKVMTEGLGRRYAFIGPLETAHLNAEGIKSYAERYNDAIYSVSETLDKHRRWQGDELEKVSEQLCQLVPLDSLGERRRWRDEKLACLSTLKNEQK